MMTEVLAFLGVCALVICTPGPDTALTIRNSITGGRRGGLLTAAGIATGQLLSAFALVVSSKRCERRSWSNANQMIWLSGVRCVEVLSTEC